MKPALLTLLQGMGPDDQEADLGHLQHLVNWLRLGAGSSSEIERRFASLVEALCADAELGGQVKAYLEQVLKETHYRYTFAELGVLGHETFMQAMKNRLFQRLLPATVEDKTVRETINFLFPKSDDHVWVEMISQDSWIRLFDALGWLDPHMPLWVRIQHEMLEAMEMLAVRIAALGIESEVVRCVGISDRHTSPFVEQHMELRRVIEQGHEKLRAKESLDDLGDHLDVLLDQCSSQIKRVHTQAKVHGISMALSIQLIRLEQSIGRMRILLQLLGALPCESRVGSSVQFFSTLVREENRKHSIKDLWDSHTDKIALRITEHASTAGGHYVAESKAEYWGIGKAALIGGFFIAVFAFIKVGLVKLHLPLLWEAVAFSLNYGACFVAVHIAHGTVATKQPAMTAARIASALDTANGRIRSFEKVVDLIAQVARTQFIAIIGNMSLAFLSAVCISAAWTFVTGSSPVSMDKSLKMLHDIDPVASAAVPYALIAGVCLFLTGVVSGYYDNLCIYERIPLRIRKVNWLRKLLGVSRLTRFADYLEHNLGALVGSLFLGLMLGSLGFVGFLLGLPIDTSHFAFSSANMGYSFQTFDFQLSASTMLISVLGIFAIGAGNLAMSFGLALYTATKARGVRANQSRAFMKKLFEKFCKQPLSFFYPPRSAVLEETVVPVSKSDTEV